jgi:hypothetical protein
MPIPALFGHMPVLSVIAHKPKNYCIVMTGRAATLAKKRVFAYNLGMSVIALL